MKALSAAAASLLALVAIGAVHRRDVATWAQYRAEASLELARRDLASEVTAAIGCPLSLVPFEPPRQPAPIHAGLTFSPEVVEIVWGDAGFFWPAPAYFRGPATGGAGVWEGIISGPVYRGTHCRGLQLGLIR